MKDAYYFKHDSNASHDPKIKALINQYGIEGYGRFWIIIEMLRESSGYKLENKQYIWDALAEQMKCPIPEMKKFIKDCSETFELLVQEDGFFYSNSLLERMVKLDDIRKKRKFAADYRHGNTTINKWDDYEA